MSLYLKYRPRDFISLVGQDFIKQTLKKAAQDNKTVGAYLFCGPRGTGKTSSARIMAKAVNCKNPINGNPCNMCEICLAINNENLVDVIEIDAASHTGVDNIREIIEKASFQPTHARYKIYIIDEVHMLSKGAFNALLKILEEPPSYVKFILATTETHKVPETIISRCQRYDFKRISEYDIKSRLSFIAGEEKVKVDDDSLKYITKSANGGLRNAISLFEQLIDDNKINYKNIIKTLGITENDLLEVFLNKIINNDTSVINDFDDLISNGKNIKLFFKELIFFTKDIAKKKALAGENINSYLHILSILDETYGKTKNSLDENTTFLIGLLKIVSNFTSPQPGQELQSSPPIPLLKKREIAQSNAGTKTVQVQKEVEVKKDLSHNDISDIFGGGEQPSPSAPLKKSNEGSSTQFNKETFIEQLKTTGAKGALTMSIRGAETSLNGDILTIKFKTSFALKSVNTPDNLALLNGAIGAMGYDNIKIEFR